MEASFTRLKSRLLLIILSLGLIAGGQAWARTTTLDHEQATLVSKFAKYVTWPTEARQRKFVIGVYDDVAKYNYFTNFFANKGVRGKDILVRLVETTAQAQDVHILYIPSLNQKKFIRLSEKISGSHVLLISESSQFSTNTMVDISYSKQDEKIILKVNDEAIIDEGLIMPELSYFLDEKTVEEILTLGPTALEKQRTDELLALKNDLQQQKKALEKQAAQQKSLLNELNKKLTLSKESSEKNNLALQKNAVRLKLAEQESKQKSEELSAQEKKLQLLKEQLQAKQAQLENTSTKSTNSNNTNALTQEEIEAKAQAITELTDKLKKQEGITNNTLTKLSNITKENESLSSFKTLFYVFVLIAIIALAAAYVMWTKAKNGALQPSSKSNDDNDALLTKRESQLIKSENLADLGYIATDITYAVGLSLEDLQDKLKAEGDNKNMAELKPITTLLENFNHIAADQDETKVRSFDLVNYMKNMLTLYDFEFSQSDIIYSYSGEKQLTVKSVPSFIAIVLLNLINNSLKHGFDNKGNGKIALTVEKGAKSGAKITYFDDGKGMNKATIKRVFEPFFTTRNDRGYVGVGMSTTYNLIKNKLAGDIKIDSQEGKGTTVTITLP